MKDLFELVIREIRGSWRFRWPAMITTWSICLLGWFFIFSMPDMYEAKTRVYVDTSSRLKNILGKITNAPDVESDVNAVRQAMLGRQQLERVARETDLFLRAETVEDEQRLLDNLATNINIAVGSRRQSRAGLYTISYTDPDKQMSEGVVRTLLDTFVEDVLEQKAQGTEEVQSFVVEQVEYYENLLEESEAALAQFKKENLGLMPGEGGGYFERLQATAAAKEIVERNLRLAMSKRDTLQQQLTGQKPLLRSNGGDTIGGGLTVSSGDPELDLRISTMQSDLSDMLLRFTDKHPDVINTRQQLDQLLAQREAILSAAAGTGGSGTSLAANPIFQATQIALNDTEVQISALRRELADYNSSEAELKALVDTAPEVEAELARLTRDYDTTRARYAAFRDQQESERILNEGETASIIKFEIIDPPSAGVDPVAPNRMVLIIVVFVLASIVGILVAYLMHQLRPVFHDSKALRQELGLPVLGEISMTWLNRHQVKRRVGMTTFSLVGIGLVFVFAGAIMFREPGAILVQAVLNGLSGGSV